MNNNVVNMSFRWSVDYDYDSQNFGCDCEIICRCSTISNEHVTSVSSIPSIKLKKDATAIEQYCIERLCVLHKVFDKELYELDVVNGYYGQEIGGVYFQNHNELQHDIDQMLAKKTDIEKVLFVLRIEYNVPSPEILKEISSVTIETVDFSDFTHKVDLQPWSKKDDTTYLFDLEDDMPIGVLRETNVNTVLIDGHHRLKDRMDYGSTEAKYIVLR